MAVKRPTLDQLQDVARSLGFHLQAILTSYEGVPKGSRRVMIRTTAGGDAAALRKGLGAHYGDVVVHPG